MDKQVLAAMARWPEVPDVYGWLSLSERGEWRLHPQGDALSAASDGVKPGSPGEPITSPPILQFINRNYAADAAGQWYFQNGPQRVYVRLDGAPHILHTTNTESGLALHNQAAQCITDISGWWLDQDGKLYAQTNLGPGLIAGRDLLSLLNLLLLPDGTSLLQELEQQPESPCMVQWSQQNPPALLQHCQSADIESILGFVRCPRFE